MGSYTYINIVKASVILEGDKIKTILIGPEVGTQIVRTVEMINCQMVSGVKRLEGNRLRIEVKSDGTVRQLIYSYDYRDPGYFDDGMNR